MRSSKHMWVVSRGTMIRDPGRMAGPQFLKVGRQLAQMLGTLMSVEVWKIFNTCKKGVDDLCGKDKERMISEWRWLSAQRSWATLTSLRKELLISEQRTYHRNTEPQDQKLKDWMAVEPDLSLKLDCKAGAFSLYIAPALGTIDRS